MVVLAQIPHQQQAATPVVLFEAFLWVPALSTKHLWQRDSLPAPGLHECQRESKKLPLNTQVFSLVYTKASKDQLLQ